MSFEVIATNPFARKLKRMAKKYKSLKTDLAALIEQLAENPTMGTPLGKECYKIRVAILSKGKGKIGRGTNNHLRARSKEYCIFIRYV